MNKYLYTYLYTVTIILIGFLTQCGVYTFNGSTLPSYLKTIEIPLFLNRSLQPGVAEELSDQLSSKVLSTNLLKVVSSNGDASINGTVLSYRNAPHTYGAAGRRQVDITEYAVVVYVEVVFMDNKKGKEIYTGRLSATGVYDFNRENEESGRKRAIADIVEQIIQNSVQGW